MVRLRLLVRATGRPLATWARPSRPGFVMVLGAVRRESRLVAFVARTGSLEAIVFGG